jgi:hypothetical protein
MFEGAAAHRFESHTGKLSYDPVAGKEGVQIRG